MKMFFPGSFDPPTIGHADIIKRLSGMCDKLYVGVLVNIKKNTRYSLEERAEMLRRIASEYPNVEVVRSEGLLVDAVRRLGADVIVKGLRNGTDFQYELDMAQVNRRISGIETVFIQTAPEYASVSSSIVRELMAFNGDVSGFVPDCITELL